MTKLKGKAYFISKKVGKAIMDYKMLSDQDKVLVGVSGGKDSLVLLKILKARQDIVPIKYSLVAVHVDMGFSNKQVETLEKYFKKINVDYHIEKLNMPKDLKETNCFWCSWNRRKILFTLADKFNCNKVALAHHLDDLIETMLLNLFFNGEISTMSPKQELFKGKLTIIRPLIYLEEDIIRRFAREEKLPVLNYRCPKAKDSRREYVAKIIKDIRKLCPSVKTNIFRSLKRIKNQYLP